MVIGCMDDPLVARLLKDIPARKVGFAIENQADWVARDIIYDDKGHPSYRGVYKGQDLSLIHI